MFSLPAVIPVKISFVKPGGAKIKYSILTMKFNLDTIIIFVQNVDKLKSFYVDMLQLEILEESKAEWLLLKAGNCQIGLHKIGEQYLAESKDEFKFDNNTKIVYFVVIYCCARLRVFLCSLLKQPTSTEVWW